MINITSYKKTLEKEKTTLEGELNTLGVHTLKEPSEWDASSLMTEQETEEGDTAMKIENYTECVALILTLQTRHQEISNALNRIKHDTYGMCIVGGKSHPIESARLNADAAAKTCVMHIQK